MVQEPSYSNSCKWDSQVQEDLFYSICMPLQFFPFVYIKQLYCIYYVCGVAIGYICMSHVKLELECGDGRGKGVILQSTYVCRVQSSVWRLPKYWPPTPSPPSECVLPRTKGTLHTRRAVRGWGVQYFERRQTLGWPLTVLSLYG